MAQNREHPEKPVVILHLSDLHFNGTEDIHATIERENVFSSLVNVIKDCDDEWRPTIICITGDVASRNQQSGYDKAAEWVNVLLDEFKIERKSVFVCPGNHDVDQGKASSLVRPHDANEADRVLRLPIAEHYKTLFYKYENFCNNMQFLPYIINDEQEYIFGKREYEGVNYVCINSCWCSMDNDDKDKLWIGQNFIKTLRLPKIEDVDLPVTISLLHHPRDFYHEKERYQHGKRESTFAYLADRSHIILTGHVHSRPMKPDIFCDNAIVFSGGCYVSGEYYNSFSLIRLWPDRLCLDYKQFEWDAGQDKWTIFRSDVNYKLRIKEKHDSQEYKILKQIEKEKLATAETEKTEEDLKKILDIIFKHVSSIDYSKAILVYQENKSVIESYKDIYPDIVEKIEILISEAKNE